MGLTPMITKPGQHKKKKPPKDRDHLNWVASQPCMIPGCSNRPAVHHIRILGEPQDDKRTIPLCWFHHQGPEGIHFLGKREFRGRYGHELNMLEKLMKRKP